jgi:hypothetical protein
LAQSGQRFAAPIAKVCDLFVNKFSWIHFSLSGFSTKPAGAIALYACS